MGFGERKKMGDNYRAAVTATVLTYIETSKQLKRDPLGLQNLSIMGGVVLGGELPDRKQGSAKNDSVWWVRINRKGVPSHYVKIADDLSKWRKQLNAQLKDWDQVSAVKELSKKRAITGIVVAAVCCAVIVATVVTAGAATGAFAAGAATASTAASANAAAAAAAANISAASASLAASGGAVGAVSAGGGAGILGALEAVDQVVSAGKGVADAAAAVSKSLPPRQAGQLTQQADAAAEAELAAIAAPVLPSWVLPATGVFAAGMVLFLAYEWTRD